MEWNLIWIIPVVGMVLVLGSFIPWGKIVKRAQTATAANTTAKKSSSKIGQELLIIAAVVIGGILFWYFGWKHFAALPITKQLMVGIGCIGLFWMLSKKPEYSLATVAKYVGIFLLIIAGLTSGLGQSGLAAIDEADAAVRAGGSVRCPGEKTITMEDRDFTLREGCETRFTVLVPNALLHSPDLRLEGTFTDYLEMRRPSPRLLIVSLKPNGLPAGMSEVQGVFVTPEEAEAIVAEIDAAPKTLVIDVSAP